MVALGSAKALAAAGHKVIVFAGQSPCDPSLEAAGVEVVCLDKTRFNLLSKREGFLRGLWDQQAAEAFENVLKRLNPVETIVHVHTHRESLSASVPAKAMDMGFKLVFSAHEYHLGCPYGAFFDEKHGCRCPKRGLSLGCLTLHCNPGSYIRKAFPVARGFRHQRAGIPGKVKDVIFVSDYSMHILDSYLPKEAARHRVDNPIAVTEEPRRPTSGARQFLSIGILHPGKNPLVAAEGALRAGQPITFAGDGQLEDDIRLQNPSARLLGWISPEEIVRQLETSRALIFVPIWPETQGMAVFEAASRGVPAIVSADCAATDFVHSHRAGVVVDPKSPESVAEAIRQLSDDDVLEEMSQNSYDAFWANPPTMERHVRELTAVYQSMLERES